MSPAGMAAMRMAATLAHALPTLRVRIRYGTATLLEVSHHNADADDVVGACAFRRAVACAHEQSKQGVRLGFLGVPTEHDPAIDVGVRANDASLPGGVYRVTIGNETIHGFVTTLPLRRCRAVLEALPDEGPDHRLHHDAATEVTFVHTVLDAEVAPPDAARLMPALEALLAEEMVRDLEATP